MTPGTSPTSQPDLTALAAFIEDFKKESDRAAVIVGAAKLDLLLYQLLQRVLLPSTSAVDELLDGDAGVGTFHSRINLAHRLGLIDDYFARALNLVRKIRNAFAHEVSSTTLEGSSHRDRVRELVSPLMPFEQFLRFRGTWTGFSGASLDFRAALGLLVLRLDQLVVSAQLLSSSTKQTLVNPKWTRSAPPVPAPSSAERGAT